MKSLEKNGLDEAFARTADGAFAIGPDGRIVLWNRAAENMLGHSAREAIGRPCCDLFVGYDDTGNRLCYQGCHVMSLVRMGDPVQSFDMRTRTRQGRPIWINLSTLTVPAGPAGGPLTVHLFRDVTATKELLGLVRERLTAAPAAEATGDALTRRELEHVLGKLGAHSRLEAVAMATRQRLL